ncbi:MAG: ATP-binding cassette domain-containing protein [Clostridiales bacterium]|nr:ATP-binding cassette domain-containing protein [Clostridiales bacterium]
MIEFKDVSFAYQKERPVLRGLDFCVRPGEWLAVIGANGSGKSTLVRLINGLLLPSSGSVLADGLNTQTPKELAQVRRLVSFVFQDPDNQLVASTVEDDVAFGLENLAVAPPEISRRVEEALRLTGLLPLAGAQVHNLSYGEKQRVALAGSLAMASHYLVLDEPTSMLDPQMRRQILGTLQYMHKNLNIAVIYVTNNMDEVFLAQKVLVLHRGVVAAQGSPREIFAQSEALLSWGLALPEICRLGGLLAAGGVEGASSAQNLEQLLEVLCKS